MNLVSVEETTRKGKGLKHIQSKAHIDKEQMFVLRDKTGEVTKSWKKMLCITKEKYTNLYALKMKISPAITSVDSDVSELITK